MSAYHRVTLSIDGRSFEYAMDIYLSGADEEAWKQASELLTQCSSFDVATVHSVVDDEVIWVGQRIADGVVAGAWKK